MKNLIIAIALGLLAGWIFSRTVLHRADDTRPAETKSDPAKLRGLSTATSTGVRFEREWSPQASDGKAYSPYRDDLNLAGRVDILTQEELVDAIRGGLFPGATELARAFGRIAEIDPVFAMELHDELPSRTDRDAARGTIISVWIESDVQGLLDFAESLERTSDQAHLVREFALSWAKEDPAAAMSKLEELEQIAGIFSEGIAESVLSTWAKNDYEAAEDWIQENADTDRRDALADALVAGRVQTLHGGAAIDFILERPENAQLQNLLVERFRNWAISDPAGAVERFASMPDGHPVMREAESLGRAALMSLHMFKKDTGDVLTYQEFLPEGEVRRQFLLGAANNASSNDIDVAQRIIAEIPESRERVRAVGFLAELWMRHDPVALSEWLTGLQPSPSRDRGVADFARLLAKSDPDRAREWASTISDPEQRERVLGRLENQ